ncbi:MAG: phosphoribosylaminoimidazolesuccinocarboxamide synthase [bacterium]
MLNINDMDKIVEGKTKIIYKNPNDSKTVYMYFKDDITAGDGIKHDLIDGKSLIDWQVNRDIFEFLNRMGIKTHYLASPQESVSLVKRLDWKVNLEVVSRRVAAGSIVKWGKIVEGTKFDPLIHQFHYKDDPLHDPMLDDNYIEYLINQRGAKEYVQMRGINEEVFLHLERAFSYFNIQLIDIKLEYGIIDKEVHLIDEISGGSFRLWPYRHDNPNLKQVNILKELNPDGRLDKDNYRMGERLDKVKNKFQEIAAITGRFSGLEG